MKREYKLKNKKDGYIVDVDIDKIYLIWDLVLIWEEKFIVIDRICYDL
jgi:hypothetical protein